MTTGPYRHRAFISYSRADAVLARALQDGLEQLAKPRGSRRIFEVFLDVKDLPAGGNLPDRLEQGLMSSEFLIVVASPDAATSHWVDEEVAGWLANRSVDNVLIVQAAGDLGWTIDPAPGWTQSSAEVLPPALREAFDEEPVWVDFREQATLARLPEKERSGRLSLDDAAFKLNVARLQACLRGPDVKPSDIVGEDLEQWRAAKRRRKIVMATLAVLTVVSVIGGLVAVVFARRSADQEREALSKQLASQSAEASDRQLDLSLLLGIEAYRADSTPEALGSLINGVSRTADVERILHDHTEPVRSVAFNRDGSLMASTGADGVVVLRDRDSTTPIGTSSPVITDAGTPALLRSLEFSPVDPLIAAADFGGTVRLWDISDPARPVERSGPVSVLRADESLSAIAFSPDGSQLASAGGNFRPDGRCLQYRSSKIIVTDLSDRSERTLADLPGCIYDLAYDPSGRVLASAHEDGTVKLWDLATGTATTIDAHPALSGSENRFRVAAIAFSPDGTRLVSAGFDRLAKVWLLGDSITLQSVFTGHEARVLDVAFSTTGADLIASGDADGRVRLWNPVDGSELRELSAAQAGDIWSVAFDPGSDSGHRQLASASSDRTVLLLSVDGGAPFARQLRPGTVRSAVFDVDRSVLITSSMEPGDRSDGTPRIVWQPVPASTPAAVTDVDSEIFALAQNQRTGIVAAGDRAGSITLWDPDSRALLYRIDRLDARCPGSSEATTGSAAVSIFSLAFDPTSSALAVGFDGGVIALMDDPLKADTVVRCRTTGDGSGAYAAAFSPRGGLLATSAGVGRVDLWDLETDHRERVPVSAAFIQSLAFSPDGAVLAIGGVDGDVVLFDVDARQPLGQPLTGHGATVRDLDFDPTGSILASASADGTVRLWNATTIEPLTDALDDPSGNVLTIEWIADGAALVSGGSVTGSQLWDLRPVALRELACRTAGRNLTAYEWDGFVGSGRAYRSSCETFAPGNTPG